MRRTVVLLFIMLSFVSRIAGQGDALVTFAAANAAYENGDYEQAISLYHSLSETGVVDGSLYYNLGNAYYQVGDTGHALVNYLRAQVIMPRDPDLGANIALVRTERVDIEGDEADVLEGLAALTSSVLTFAELAILVGGLWTGWCGLLVVIIIRYQWREVLRGPLFVAGFVLLVGGLLLISRVLVTETRPAAVVVVSSVPVMSGPGDDYLDLYTLHSAAEIRIVEQRANWTRFSLPDGRQGWIPDEAVESVR
ncbi:MAG: hypothetical protein K8I60_02425 [Anaerolineae bacterium]|nr:hypothetical protein [Anaerolineae bacterium]